MHKHDLEAIRTMLTEALETKNRERVVNALALIEVCLASWDDGLRGGRREWVPGFGEVIIGPEPEFRYGQPVR